VLTSPAVIPASRRDRFSSLLLLALAGLAFAATGCRKNPSGAFAEIIEARRLTADLRVQFTKAADASNRAVMADTDEASEVFAHEAEQRTETVQSDVAALSAHLRDLDYLTELRLLDEFKTNFAEYLKLDHVVLELAVENTNLKAQRLSFGPAREAADGFRSALDALGPRAKDHCRFDALVSKAVLAVRDIQVDLAPHIAEADDSAMTRMEAEMAGRETAASDALEAIPALIDPVAGPQVAEASASLARFKEISHRIVALSRRNTNVRSLALSLREKPVLTAACDDGLHALETALEKERFAATR
jgi:hypothetical protein